MTAPRPLPSELGDCFSTAQALKAGATRRRMRAGDLRAPFHGARTTSVLHEPPAKLAEGTLAERVRRLRANALSQARAYVCVMPSGAFFIGRTAAVIYGAPVDPGPEIDVALFAPAHCPRGVGVSGRKVSPRLVQNRLVDGLPVSDPASTWAMLAEHLSVKQLIVVGDYFARIPRDERGVLLPAQQLATKDDLRKAIVGRRHAAKLRKALERIRVGVSSPLETEYRLVAEDFGLPEPVIDFEVHDEHGRLLGISEYAYPEYKIAIEIEGDHHRTSKRQWDRDIEKYRAYEASGWKTIRLTSRHILESVLGVRIVTEALVERGWADPAMAGDLGAGTLSIDAGQG